MPAPRQIGQHLFAFVVRMRADHHDAAQSVELFERLADFDFAGNAPLAADGDQAQNQQRTDRCARRPAAERDSRDQPTS